MATTLISLPYDILLLVSELAFEAGLKDDILGWSLTCKATRAACLPVLFRNRTIVCKEHTQDWQLPEHAGLRSYCRNLKADVSAACDGTDPPITSYFTTLISVKIIYSSAHVAGRHKLLNPAAWLATNFPQSKGAMLQHLDIKHRYYWDPTDYREDDSSDADEGDNATSTSRFYPLNIGSLLLPLLPSLRRLEIIAPSAHFVITASNAAAACSFPMLEVFITDCQELAATDVSDFLTRHQSITSLSLRTTFAARLTHLINIVHDSLPNVRKFQIIRVLEEARARACNSPLNPVRLPRLELLAVEDTDLNLFSELDEESQYLATSMINNMGRIQAQQLRCLYVHFVLQECHQYEQNALFAQLADPERHPHFTHLFGIRKGSQTHMDTAEVEPYPWKYAETKGYADQFPGPLVPIQQ